MSANSGSLVNVTVIPFNTLVSGTESVFNTSTYKFVAPITGFYAFGYNLNISSTGGYMTGYCYTWIDAPDGAYGRNNLVFGLNVTDRWGLCGNAMIYLLQNQVVDVRAQIPNSSIGTAEIVYSSGSQFYGYLVNPI
jgi:hypothetical protein